MFRRAYFSDVGVTAKLARPTPTAAEVEVREATGRVCPSKPRPTLCFVGPMVGRNPGYVTTQGELLGSYFASAGYEVVTVSALPNRYLRLIDIVTTLALKARRSDIQCLQVYSGWSFVVVDIASWLGKVFGQRLIMALHGGAIPEFMGSYPRWSRRVLRRADALVAPSAFLSGQVGQYGFSVQVIPNVVELTDYKYTRREFLKPRLLWMRAFHPVYNPAMALRVLVRVRKVVADATLVMAGQDKGTQEQVRRLAKTLGVGDGVQFPGYLDMAAKLEAGRNSDIFLNTSRVDNMPVTVLEACAMGLPVVATNVGGMPALLTDNETGLLVGDDDDASMAAAVLRLLHEPELACRLSTYGRQLAERCSRERVQQEWEALFVRLMTRPAF
jgi:L-malate glycosyltransferase